MTLPNGCVVAGRYRVEGLLGAGGFGHVYRATQIELDRAVALKVLAGAALASPEQVARFRREASLAQKLEHPNTVRLLDHGVDEAAGPYIVMELLRGESLASLLAREGPQPDTRVARVAQQVLKALMEAHAHGIVHRDIKPANVFITSHAGEPFFVRLLDFGIAKDLSELQAPGSSRGPVRAAGAVAGGLTAASHVMGTPQYMAPEQARGEPVGPATDVHAVGLMLAEMVSGRPVFGGEDLASLVARSFSDAPPALDPVVLRSALAPVIERALRPRASDRFASAAEMLEAVMACGVGSVLEDRPTGRSHAPMSALAFAPTVETPLESRRAGADPRARRRRILGAVGVATVGAAVAVGAAYSRVPRAAEPDLVASSRGAPAYGPATSTATAPAEPSSRPRALITELVDGGLEDRSPDKSGIVVLTPPLPKGGFESDPRRKTTLPKIDPAKARAATIASGFEVTSGNAMELEGGRKMSTWTLKKQSCVGHVEYNVFASEEEAREYAQARGTSSDWVNPILVTENRVLSLSASAPSQEEAYACTSALWRAVLGFPFDPPAGR